MQLARKLAEGNPMMAFLDRWRSFLSSEVKRQGIDDDLPQLFICLAVNHCPPRQSVGSGAGAWA